MPIRDIPPFPNTPTFIPHPLISHSPQKEILTYQSILSDLRYLADCTRPGIAIVTSRIFRHTQAPTPTHANVEAHDNISQVYGHARPTFSRHHFVDANHDAERRIFCGIGRPQVHFRCGSLPLQCGDLAPSQEAGHHRTQHLRIGVHGQQQGPSFNTRCGSDGCWN